MGEERDGSNLLSIALRRREEISAELRKLGEFIRMAEALLHDYQAGSTVPRDSGFADRKRDVLARYWSSKRRRKQPISLGLMRHVPSSTQMSPGLAVSAIGSDEDTFHFTE